MSSSLCPRDRYELYRLNIRALNTHLREQDPIQKRIHHLPTMDIDMLMLQNTMTTSVDEWNLDADSFL